MTTKKDRYAHLSDDADADGDSETTQPADGGVEPDSEPDSTSETSTVDVDDTPEDVEGIRVTITDGENETEFTVEDDDASVADIEDAVQHYLDESESQPQWERGTRTSTSMSKSMVLAGAVGLQIGVVAAAAALRRRSKKN